MAMKIANKIGVPVDVLMKRLPMPAQAAIAKVVHRSLERCLRVALRGMKGDATTVPSNHGHTVLTAASGAVGGFFRAGRAGIRDAGLYYPDAAFDCRNRAQPW